MHPRYLVTPTTYLLTRSCVNQQFWLLPRDPRVAQIFLYCLAVAAAEFGIQIHAVCVLSNHWHVVLTDHRNTLPKFAHWVHKHTASALNALYGTTGPKWDHQRYSAVALRTPDAIYNELVYTICNPVSSHLVPRPSDWPGLISLPADLAGGRRYTPSRPSYYFSSDGDCPTSARLELTVPPLLESTPAKFRAELHDRCTARARHLRNQRSQQGKGFLGLQALHRQRRTDTPVTPRTERPRDDAISPHVMNSAEETQTLQAFRRAHRDALEAWPTDRDVVFPHGTYRMRVFHNARCAPT